MSPIRWWKSLPNDLKQLIFVLGVLGGGFELVMLLAWLVGGDSGAGGALLFLNGTVAVCVGVILLAKKIFPEKRQ